MISTNIFPALSFSFGIELLIFDRFFPVLQIGPILNELSSSFTVIVNLLAHPVNFLDIVLLICRIYIAFFV